MNVPKFETNLGPDRWVSWMSSMGRGIRMVRRDRITAVDRYHHTSSA